MCDDSRRALFLHPPSHKSKSPWLFALLLRPEGFDWALVFREYLESTKPSAVFIAFVLFFIWLHIHEMRRHHVSKL